MKRCFKCGEDKPLSQFYKHKQMADGHLNKCKECAKKDVHVNRINNIDHYRKYDRDRGNRQPPDYLRKWRKTNPKKWACHVKLNNEIRKGNITRKPCEECGASGLTHAHHDDYSIPLDVRWLCPACHKQWHTENGEAKNSRNLRG
jgi:hypothetical protein